MHTNTPVVLVVVAEELSYMDPPADKPTRADPRQMFSGLTRLITRPQTGIHARVHVQKNRRRSSVFTVAAKRFKRIASRLHAYRIACKSSMDGHGLHDHHGTLRSDEEWSTCTSSAENPTAQGPGDFKDVEI